MSSKPQMLTIGTATQDVFLVGGKLFAPHREHGVDYEHIPLGEKLELENVIFSVGGNALNAAVTFARQGLDTEFMGVLGVDAGAQAAMELMDTEGIGTRHAHQDDKYHTSYSSILLAPTGERTVLRFQGSKLRADGADLDMGAIAKADWLYVSSVGSMDLLNRIVTLASKNGVKVAFNPSTRELEHPDKIRTLLDDITVLIANKEEMALLVEGKTTEELVRHAAHLVPIVLVSDGPRGAMATDGKQLVKAGMYEDVKVIDRLGAGDAFGAGFVAMHAQGKTLEEAITFASANSTSVVTKIGANVGVLHRNTQLHDMPLKVVDF